MTEFSTDNLEVKCTETWGWTTIDPKISGVTEKDWKKCTKCNIGTKKMSHFQVIDNGNSLYPLCDNVDCEDAHFFARKYELGN